MIWAKYKSFQRWKVRKMCIKLPHVSEYVSYKIFVLI